MIDMEEETVTLVAACIAATASVFGLVFNALIARSREGRESHRRLLEPHLAPAAEALHTVVACADIIAKTKTDESRGNWRDRATNAREMLEGVRRAVRYPLWGADDGLRTIQRLPNWVENARGLPEHATSLLKSGDDLREALDAAFRSSHARGSAPTFLQRRRINKQAKKLRAAFKALLDEKQAARSV